MITEQKQPSTIEFKDELEKLLFLAVEVEKLKTIYLRQRNDVNLRHVKAAESNLREYIKILYKRGFNGERFRPKQQPKLW